MTTTTRVKLKIGQVWRSRDKREKRRIVVRGFAGDKVIVQNADTIAAQPQKLARKPTTTKVSTARFNTNSSRGYELEQDAP